jgi:acyl-homoserine-lactone acylase
MALAYGPDGPEAKVFLTYGNTEDREAETYTSVTERFSEKDWREVAFTDAAVGGRHQHLDGAGVIPS